MRVHVSRAKEIDPEEYQLYLNWILERLQILEEQHKLPGLLGEEYGLVEAALRYFFWDNKSCLYKYIVDGDIKSFLAVRELPDNVLFIQEGKPRKVLMIQSC